MGDRLVITILLPVDVDDVTHVLNAVADRWPNALVDSSHEEGWHVTVSAEKGTPR